MCFSVKQWEGFSVLAKGFEECISKLGGGKGRGENIKQKDNKKGINTHFQKHKESRKKT